jgi:hypothetical protein
MSSLVIILQDPLDSLSEVAALAVIAGLLLSAAALLTTGHFKARSMRRATFALVAFDPSRYHAAPSSVLRSLVVLVCGLLLLVLWPTGAHALDRKVESETMTLSGSSVKVHSSISGSKDVAYYTNGSARAAFEGAATQVTLRARGTACQGVPARLKVYVDGSYKAAASVGNYSSFTNYPVALPGVGGGAHTLRVAFENDYFSSRCDRNAYLDYATLALADVLSPSPPGGGDPSSGGKPTCTDSLQSRISAAPAGSTLNVRGDCIYREPRITVSKPLALVGEPGAEIRGSDLWTSFSARANGNYVSSHTLPTFSQGTTPCNPGTSECSRPEQVFVDGQPLQQLKSGSDPRAGQFALDSGRRVVLGFDPTGKRVEVTTRTQWLRVTATAGPVVVDNIDMSHAANASGYHGALLGDGVANITVKNSHLSYTHGAVLSLNGGSNMLAQNNEIDHGGQLGVHAYRGKLTLIGNEIHHNNVADYDDSYEAGGVKATNQKRGGLWRYNVVHHDNGTGLWCDIDCTNVEIAFNRVHHSAKSGIFYEISYGGNIHDNVLYENGWEDLKPGIRVGNSSNTQVVSNVLAWNYKGVGFERSNRSDQGADKNDNRNVAFSGNWVIQKDEAAGASMISCELRLAASICDYYDNKAFDPTRSITFRGDAYWFSNLAATNAPRFNAKNKGYTAIDAWNATAYASAERYMTAADKNSLIATHNLPASPER